MFPSSLRRNINNPLPLLRFLLPPQPTSPSFIPAKKNMKIGSEDEMSHLSPSLLFFASAAGDASQYPKRKRGRGGGVICMLTSFLSEVGGLRGIFRWKDTGLDVGEGDVFYFSRCGKSASK